ncbi:CHAT domain-containing protein [Flammeovirga sp. OC4]|uniref:CHAT domain-containing protein n=1 Tax=Flammeovirga sp. OC4 TaxID=1382345 RepID=UPI0009E3F898|nr:CHAT domain-containing protein [Flammeovirga sp. OC4]
MRNFSKLLLCTLLLFLCHHFPAWSQEINNSKALRAALPAMKKEKKEVDALNSAYRKQYGDEWKAKWAEKVIENMKGKDFFVRSAATVTVYSYFKPQENQAIDQLRKEYLEEVKGFIFGFEMDEKESFEEMEELFEIIDTYLVIQTQANPMLMPLQKLADKFFYVKPYLARLDVLYKNASAEEKEEYEDFYNDVQRFWKNAKAQSLNFSRIIREELSKKTMDYQAIFGLVNKMYSSNQYYLGAKLTQKAVEQLEATNNTSHYFYQSFLMSLGNFYSLQENYEKMLEVQLKQEKLGLLSHETTLIYSYLQLKDYEKSLELAEAYLSKIDPTNPFYFGIINCKISCLFGLERYDEAYDASMEMMTASEEQGKDVNSGSYFTLGEICKRKEDPEQAEDYFFDAFEKSKVEIGRLPDMGDMDNTAMLTMKLYNFYYYMMYVGELMTEGKADKIDLNKIFEEYDSFDYIIRNILLNPSKLGKKEIINISEQCGDIMYQLAANVDRKEAKQLAYNYTLLSKEIDLSSVIAIRKYAADSKNKDYKGLFEEWMKVRKEILFHEEGLDIDSLKDISFGLHKELAIKTKEQVFSEMEKNTVEWKQVQAALKDNQIAVEYVFYAPDSYAALVLKKDMDSPVIIPLCKEKELKKWLEPEQRMSEINGIDYVYNQNGKQILSLIVDPLRPYLSDVKTIFYAPSGILHGISLEALKLSSDETAKRLGKEFRLKRVSKTSLLAQQTKLSPRKATIFGGMNYDDQALQEQSESGGERGLKVKNKKKKSSAPSAPQENQIQMVGGTFNYLRGTLKEVDLINEELTSSSVEVDLYTGNSATEDQFIEYCKAPTDILHIASHAYFSPYIKKEKIAEGSFKGAKKIYSDPDPMNRAGIVFSGANYFWETGQNFEDKSDGILMASELSNYDLRKTNLAIVSACQSGIGQSTRSEGVYGFQRAFKLAGIEHQIISLWTVDDAATQKFMTLFYKYYVELSDIDLAVVKAKEELQQEYEHPYYWAAFVHVQ